MALEEVARELAKRIEGSAHVGLIAASAVEDLIDIEYLETEQVMLIVQALRAFREWKLIEPRMGAR